MAYVSSFSKVFRHDIIHFQLSPQHFFQVLSNQLATFHHFNPYYYSKIQLKNRTIFFQIYIQIHYKMEQISVPLL